MNVKCFYNDPYERVAVKTELPSILKDTGRFVVPDL